MKTRSILKVFIAVVVTGIFQVAPVGAAERRGNDDSMVEEVNAAPAAPKRTKHQKLCDMLGLMVNGRYEFRLSVDKVFYYEIKSLGANGWIQVEGFQFPDRWVNLSQVIAITPIPMMANDPRMRINE